MTVDWPSRVRSEIGSITGDPSRDDQIHIELADHCRQREADLIGAGQLPDEAIARTIAELHELARRRAPLVASIRPPATGAARMSLTQLATQILQDIRYAARLLRRTPATSVAIVLTLALAIGATTAVFSVIKGVLLDGLPYPEADQLVRVWEVSPTGNERNVVSAGNVLDWRDQARSFSHLGAYQQPFSVVLTGSGEPERIQATSISGPLLSALGAQVQRGRLFEAAELQAGGPRAVLLSHRFWQRRFGGDPSVVSRTMTLDGVNYTIVGVMPQAFQFPTQQVDTWMAHRFSEDDRQSRRAHHYNVVARLAPGVSLGAAQAEMAGIASSLAARYPQDMKGWGVNVVAAHADAVGDVRSLLWLLFGVTAVVLLVACANLANLQLARASQRAAEVAVRSAIGARRGRLMLQFLTENLLLAVVGGGLGLATVALTLKGLLALAPPEVPFLDAVRLDGGVWLFSAAATMVSAILVGFAPAWHLSRSANSALLQSVRVKSDPGQTRLRHSLVTAQVALALVLLVAAAMMVRSMWQLQSVDPGFESSGVLAAGLNLPGARYADNATHTRFYEGLAERVRAIAGVTAVATTSADPGSGSDTTFSFAIEGRVAKNPSGREDPEALQAISASYFETMRIPVTAGRAFDAAIDRADGTPVVVLNESLARKHWPNGDAIGKRIAFRVGQTPWREIVGIVGDTHDAGPGNDVKPTIYVPLAQKEATWVWLSWQTLLVRTNGDPSAIIPSVRSVVHGLDADLPLLRTVSLEEALAESEATRTFAMRLFGAFALVTLLLGAVGIYGVLSYSVSSRSQEIGIRMALGAQPVSVWWSVLKPVWMATAAGVLIGTAGAALGAKFLESLLFGIPTRDVLSFVSMAFTLIAVAIVASWWPARRATRLDPVSVLRD